MDKTTKQCPNQNRDCHSVKSDNETIDLIAAYELNLN